MTVNKVKIFPSAVSGSIAAPPSKSMAHRLLICAGLADGVSTVRGISPSQDILATSDCLETLGARISVCGIDQSLEMVAGCDPRNSVRVVGCDPRLRTQENFECRESGSTLRFMIPLAVLSDRRAFFRGSETLLSRPLSVYEEIFQRNGLHFGRLEQDDVPVTEWKSKLESKINNEPSNNRLIYRKSDLKNDLNNDLKSAPRSGGLCVSGPLAAGEYIMDGSVSSQFVSGMLFALSVTPGLSTIRLMPPVESRPYIDMTVSALREFGAEIQQPDDTTIRIQGRKMLSARDCIVEGDWSNAAFLLALGAEVTGLDNESLQGDRICTELFRQLDSGCAEIDISDCPDLGPVLMAYAAMRNGAILHGAGRLRIKESDRGSAMKQELVKFGVSVEIDGDDIYVGCGVRTPSGILDGHNDHRIVMSMAVLCAETGGTIAGAEAVNKSYPDFFEDIRKLGIRFAEA